MFYAIHQMLVSHIGLKFQPLKFDISNDFELMIPEHFYYV